MIDITKQQEKKPFDRKGYLFDMLIAALPATLVVGILREEGIVGGALPILIAYFGGAALVGFVRRRRGWVVTRKKIWYALAAYPTLFIVLPVAIYVTATSFRYVSGFFSAGSSAQERLCLEHINYNSNSNYYYFTNRSNKKYKTHDEAMNACTTLEFSF